MSCAVAAREPIVIELPLRTRNPLNGQTGNSRLASILRTRTRAKERAVTLMATVPQLVESSWWYMGRPCDVTLTRISSGTMDTDGLAASFKGVRDGVATALAIDDGDTRVSWTYKQEKRTRSRGSSLPSFAIRIEIRQRDTVAPNAQSG